MEGNISGLSYCPLWLTLSTTTDSIISPESSCTTMYLIIPEDHFNYQPQLQMHEDLETNAVEVYVHY